jgi:hypothetical protein
MMLALRRVQRLSSSQRVFREFHVPVATRRAFSDLQREENGFITDAVVHARGDLPYGSREYVLLPPYMSLEDLADEEKSHLKLASLQAHRNVIFGAVRYSQKKFYSPNDDDDDVQTLSSACMPLLDAAMVDASEEGEPPQAISTLYGLSVWATAALLGRAPSKAVRKMQRDPEKAVALEAALSIATGIPRRGRLVVDQGTYRDGAAAWEELAKEYGRLHGSEECQLYQARGAELVGIDPLADTSPDYMRSAGGSMARFSFP